MLWELIKLRKLHNVSQKELAKVLGISVSAYSMKENGVSPLKLDEAFTIASLFNKRVEEIFPEIFLKSNIEKLDISKEEKPCSNG